MKRQTFWALDLEMEQPSGEIISIGVTIPDLGCYNYFITPSQPLSQFIKDLTGYDDHMFCWDKSRKECFQSFTNLMNDAVRMTREHSYSELCKSPLTWGQGDTPLLIEELRTHGIDYSAFLGRRCIDVKTVYLMDRLYQGFALNNRTSLSSAAKTLKIDMEFHKAHNSMDDAILTREVFEALVEKNTKRNDAIKTLIQNV